MPRDSGPLSPEETQRILRSEPPIPLRRLVPCTTFAEYERQVEEIKQAIRDECEADRAAHENPAFLVKCHDLLDDMHVPRQNDQKLFKGLFERLKWLQNRDLQLLEELDALNVGVHYLNWTQVIGELRSSVHRAWLILMGQEPDSFDEQITPPDLEEGRRESR